MLRNSRALAACLSLLAASLLVPASASPSCEPVLTMDPSPVTATLLVASAAADGRAEVCGTGVEATVSGQVCLPECLDVDTDPVRFDPCQQPDASCPRGAKPNVHIELRHVNGAGPIITATHDPADWQCTKYPGSIQMRVECTALRAPPVGFWECYQVSLTATAGGASHVKGKLQCDQEALEVPMFWGPDARSTQGNLGRVTTIVCAAEGWDAYIVECRL